MKKMLTLSFNIICWLFFFQSCMKVGNILPDSISNNSLDPQNPQNGTGGIINKPEDLFVANLDGIDAIFEIKGQSITKHTVLPENTYLNSAVLIDQKIYYSLESVKFNVLGVSEVYELDIKTGISKKISQFHQDAKSGVHSIAKAGQVLYASVQSNNNGFELYKYSNNQWQLTKDIEAGSVGSFPMNFLELNQVSYFLAYQANSGMELWSTKDGGSLHANLYTGAASSHVMPWFTKDNKIIATLKNPNSTTYDLYSIDEQGVMMILVSPGVGSNTGANPLSAYPFKNGVVANCYHSSNGRELCVSSNLSGQWSILDINSGSKSSNPKFFTLYKDQVYFQAEGSTGIELYRSNGTSFEMINDLLPGSASSYPENLMVIGEKLYFSAYGAQGPGMYSYDGASIVKITLQQKDLKFARSLLKPSR